MTNEEKTTEDLLDALQKSVDRARNDLRRTRYKDKVAAGAKLFGGHLGTCDAPFGSFYCNCGKEDR